MARGCMRWAGRQDGNHSQIVKDLRAAGVSVWETKRLGNGAPDLVLGWQQTNFLAEVKLPGETLRPNQAEWWDGWRGLKPLIITSATDALKALGIIK